MAIEFRTKRVTVPKDSGTRELMGSVDFTGPVTSAQVALNGFRLDFSSSDHHINVIEVNTARDKTRGQSVDFVVRVQYADKNFDDLYQGFVDVLVLADVAS